MDNLFQEKACLCALNRIFGFEPRIGLRLIETFGSASDVFRQNRKKLTDALGAYSSKDYSSKITVSAFESASMELETLSNEGCSFIGIGEEGYPVLLRECEDPPLGLYFKGSSSPEEVFNQRPQIAVVGTRSLTSYGKEWCQRIVQAMSKARTRPLVVSGLALGVDVTAHKAALDSGIPTVAVLPTGIDAIYPQQNENVAGNIASTEGCALVTDYPPGTSAMRINFLRRNRIIAGICSATILIESKIKGGGMMTARLAGTYDRDVFAVPGRLDDPLSQGCNMLIRENLAQSIGGIAGLIEDLGLGRVSITAKDGFRDEVGKHYGEGPLLKAAMTIKSHRGISVDELCSILGMPYNETINLVTTLECDGFISVDLLQHCSAKYVSDFF